MIKMDGEVKLAILSVFLILLLGCIMFSIFFIIVEIAFSL